MTGERAKSVEEARADVDEIVAFLCQTIRDGDPIAVRAFRRAKPIFYRRVDALIEAARVEERAAVEAVTDDLARAQEIHGRPLGRRAKGAYPGSR